MAAAVIALGVHLEAQAAENDPIDFFERRIRPLLAENCYECHSAKEGKSKGGLQLDTKQATRLGGSSGKVIEPGNPDSSLLIQAVRYTNPDLQMPPEDKRLTPQQIADLEQWVAMGAPDPRTGAPEDAIAAAASDHWSFQPVVMPEVPQPSDSSWIKSPIDAFVLQKLEEAGMHPNPPADKRTLIRRAAHNLTGLPPTPEEVDAFLADQSEDAFSKVVENYLGSPRYGERWARHWLDVARYSDTKGYVFEEERRFPYSYTYRDYVIRAFNDDLPYDEFLIQQIAADQLALGENKQPLAALGFLTLGRRFLNNQADIIDDRIDVVTRGTMALTVACARCHDHKYDPIPTADYYSLYGVFASSEEPDERPLLGGDPPSRYDEYLKEKEKRLNKLTEFKDTKSAEALKETIAATGQYLWIAHQTSLLDDKSEAEGIARKAQLDPDIAGKWTAYLENLKQDPGPVFGLWFQFASLQSESFADGAKRIQEQLRNGEAPQTNNPLVREAFIQTAPETMEQAGEIYGELFKKAHDAWNEVIASDKEAKSLADASLEQLRQPLYVSGPTADLDYRELSRTFDVPTRQRARALQREVDELDATHPGAPPRAMALVDRDRLVDPRIFIRGNARNPGDPVPRQFLSFLEDGEPEPFKKGSGRLELAQAIASPDNPLTARVFVNRVWLQHFGTGLVDTPSDFGQRCQPPLQRELLDYLAARFMRENWSVKDLHRWIMLSSVYQQSSETNPDYVKRDPANQFLWRMNRQRLDLESMRDTLLAVAGRLDLEAGGRGVDIVSDDYTPRRTVYGYIDRQNLASLFRTFDFASPDTSNPKRFTTSVPQQALYLLNSRFTVDQAKALASLMKRHGGSSEASQIEFAFRRLYQRSPTPRERELMIGFLKVQRERPAPELESPPWEYGYGTWDRESKALTSFTPFPHFTGQAWQGGNDLPDGKLGWATLNDRGGHPGNDLRHAVARRWIAPAAGTVTIGGRLRHDSKEGDGVAAHLFSSKAGLIQSWTAHNSSVRTGEISIEVVKGENLHFVTELRDSISHDSFEWAPRLSLQSHGSAISRTEWNARQDFGGPQSPSEPLEPVELLAQALLMANELHFVD